jgi:hypothetical protein
MPQIQRLAGVEERCPQQGGDFNGDCTADFNDVIKLAEIWLMSDRIVQASPPDDSRLQAFYMFDENTGDIAYDSSGKLRHAAIYATDINNVWAPGWQAGGSVSLDGASKILVPQEALSNITNELSISVFVNTASNPVSSVDFAAGPTDPNLWDQVSWEPQDINDAEDIWVNYAFIKDVNSSLMRIYRDGLLIANDINAIKPIDGAGAGTLYIGCAPDGSDYFTGMVDNFRIYDYALSQSEILFLAAGGSGQIYQPIVPYLVPFDPYNDGTINFRDFSILADQWLDDLVPNN